MRAYKKRACMGIKHLKIKQELPRARKNLHSVSTPGAGFEAVTQKALDTGTG